MTGECNHNWRTCPVHNPDLDEVPLPFTKVMTCIYGGTPLKNGGTWDQDTSQTVVDSMLERWDDC